MAARQARGIKDARKVDSVRAPRPLPSLGDGSPYRLAMRVRHTSGGLGQIAWVTWSEKTENWEAVVSWDAQSEHREAPPCRQPLHRLRAA